MLLSRDQFRTGVLARDGNKCVICGKTHELAVHHIMERRLFSDGGYYLDNGASLCPEHHLQAEQTLLSCEAIRKAGKISKIILPMHLDATLDYDKWGNQLLANGTRLKGELFFEEPVQKMLQSANLLPSFSTYLKHPRTMHLLCSPNLQNNDRQIASMDQLLGHECVATIKLDGENTSLYPNYIHARSIDSRNHPSRNLVRAMLASIQPEIPDGWRIVGENVYAKHSIGYDDLESFFYVFSIWNEQNVALSWDETIGYSQMLGLSVVPTLFRGILTDKVLADLSNKIDTEQKDEGFVVRRVDSIRYQDWDKRVAKYVRKNHVQTDQHWTTTWTPNKLKT